MNNNKIDDLLLEQVEFILKSRQPLLATARLAAAASWLRNLTWSREAPAFPDNNQPMAEDLPSELFLGGSHPGSLLDCEPDGCLFLAPAGWVLRVTVWHGEGPGDWAYYYAQFPRSCK